SPTPPPPSPPLLPYTTLFRSGQPFDHATDRLLPLSRRQRRHRLLLLARGKRHRGGQAGIDAGGARDALDLGPQHGGGRRLRRTLGGERAPARQRSGAVAPLRPVPTQIVERARVVGATLESLPEGL